MNSAMQQLGDILVEAGIITRKTLERALERQKRTGKKLPTVFEEMEVVTRDELLEAMSKQLNLKVVRNLASYTFPRELLDLVSEDLAVQKSIFPLKDQQGVLALAVADPFDHETLDFLGKQTGRRIIAVLATPDDISAAIDKHYLGEKPAKRGARKVLVVDDSQPIAAIIEAALQKDGYEVVVAYDGLLGLKLAITHLPDLIICDSVMPRMDGFGMFRALQANPATAGIPVILLTSKAGSEEEQKALEAGFLDFIAKPVQPVRVTSRVRRAFELMGKMQK